MKTATKVKIIELVKRVLKFEEPVEINGKKRDVVNVQCSMMLNNWDAKYDIHDIVPKELARELNREDLITYGVKKMKDKSYVVRASVKVVRPDDDDDTTFFHNPPMMNFGSNDSR